MVLLTFKDHTEQPLAALQLAPLQLRQWLHILYDQFRQAEWSTTEWPSWMEAKSLESELCRVVLH